MWGGDSTLDALSDILPATGVHGAVRRGAGHAGRRTGPHVHADTTRHEKGWLPAYLPDETSRPEDVEEGKLQKLLKKLRALKPGKVHSVSENAIGMAGITKINSEHIRLGQKLSELKTSVVLSLSDRVTT